MDLVVDLLAVFCEPLLDHASLFFGAHILECPWRAIGVAPWEFFILKCVSNHVVLVFLCRKKLASP